jgi:hypothetical protein
MADLGQGLPVRSRGPSQRRRMGSRAGNPAGQSVSQSWFDTSRPRSGTRLSRLARFGLQPRRAPLWPRFANARSLERAHT